LVYLVDIGGKFGLTSKLFDKDFSFLLLKSLETGFKSKLILGKKFLGWV